MFFKDVYLYWMSQNKKLFFGLKSLVIYHNIHVVITGVRYILFWILIAIFIIIYYST